MSSVFIRKKIRSLNILNTIIFKFIFEFSFASPNLETYFAHWRFPAPSQRSGFFKNYYFLCIKNLKILKKLGPVHLFILGTGLGNIKMEMTELLKKGQGQIDKII